MNNMSELIRQIFETEDTNLTPIEIALGIDESGRTTARRLYDFLELNTSNYSGWARRNIIENEFAEINVDYIPFVVYDERNPKPTTDYKLTPAFAKKLAMGTHNLKGEAAKNYFIKVEEKLKQKSIDTSNLSPVLQMFKSIFDKVAQQELEQKEMALALMETNQDVQNIRDGVIVAPEDWRKYSVDTLRKIAFKKGMHYDEVMNLSYDLFDSKGYDLNKRLKNRKEMAVSYGVAISKVDRINKLDCIGEDKRMINIYVNIVKALTIKYKIA
jgi:anti-repressor protein